MGNKIGAFIAGGAIGAAVALLFAPRPGDETRAIVTDWSSNALGNAGKYAERAQRTGEAFVHDTTLVGKTIYGKAAEQVQTSKANVAPVFTERNEELRTKIEEARQRIATQVAQNASGARDAINDTIPVVTDAANKAGAAAKDAADKAGAAAKGAADKATGAAKDAAGKATEAAKGAAEAVADVAGKAAHAAKEVADDASKKKDAE